MSLVKHILFHNFWSFLFVLSGVVDVGIGVVSFFTGTLNAQNSTFPMYVVCFIVGGVYLSIGFTLAVVKMRKPNS